MIDKNPLTCQSNLLLHSNEPLFYVFENDVGWKLIVKANVVSLTFNQYIPGHLKP